MQTRTVELTSQWVLVTTGPASFISLEPGKRGRVSALQVIISDSVPADGAEGHEVTALTNAVLDAGENLYARSNGKVGSLVITDTPIASRAFTSAPPVTDEGKIIQPAKMNVMNNTAKKFEKKQGGKNG